MKSLWDDAEAAQYKSDLELRVYTSQLLGRDHTLVLHGGGNTSVKLRERLITGEEEDILYVKGSGWDLETIREEGFAPVRLEHLIKLSRLESLSDPQMMNELNTQVTRAGAPSPSVEAILHAILPHKYVDHTHADALLSITNTRDGAQRIREIYGRDTVIIPYVMPGFDLAKLCACKFASEAHPGTIGMVLMNHGMFSFGSTAQESYERMIELVGRAEDYLRANSAWDLPAPASTADADASPIAIATLRREIATAAGQPMVMATHSDPEYLAFSQHADADRLSQQGPATPDHVLRTKRVPALGSDVSAFADAYRTYFADNEPQAKDRKTMLDPAPRVVLDPKLGMCTVGRTAKDARIVHNLYSHTIDVIRRAEALGGYIALGEKDIFDVEYWDLEQAKLRKAGKAPVFTGEVVLVTGAASGIGRACVDAFLNRGAAVIGLDIDPRVSEAVPRRANYLGVTCDVTAEREVDEALEAGVRAFGGIDMLVLNAGIFGRSERIAEMSTEEWRRVMQINIDANLALLRACHPLLRLAPNSGRVVVVGSKNVLAPGPGAAAYSASKAAMTQLARVAALEWGSEGIRINVIHPNAVFDTGIWTDEVLAARAAQYRLSVDDYKKNNVLKTEVRSVDVAEMAAEMCGPLFAKTTGAQVPIDGGNERVI